MDKITRNILLFIKITQALCIFLFVLGIAMLYVIIEGHLNVSYAITAVVCVFNPPLLFMCATVVDIGIKRKVKEYERENDITP